MKSGSSFALVLVTAPNVNVARKLARRALDARVAACANLIPGVESHYWWKNKIERGKEILILFKTMKSRLKELEKLIVEHHPYDTPEFVVTPIQGGAARYLAWMETSVRPA